MKSNLQITSKVASPLLQPTHDPSLSNLLTSLLCRRAFPCAAILKENNETVLGARRDLTLSLFCVRLSVYTSVRGPPPLTGNMISGQLVQFWATFVSSCSEKFHLQIFSLLSFCCPLQWQDKIHCFDCDKCVCTGGWPNNCWKIIC